MASSSYHIPVLCTQVLDCFKGLAGDFLDATLGGGGHTNEILQEHKNVRVFAIDRDLEAISHVKERLVGYLDRLNIFHGNYSDVDELDIPDSLGGILMDVGVSSHQIDKLSRGFSFQGEGVLDMRMDFTQKLTAYKIVNYTPEKELADIFYEFGEEKKSRLIAKKIVQMRKQSLYHSTVDLVDTIATVVPRNSKFFRATCARVFQAIRIAVNNELESLVIALEKMFNKLSIGGKLAVISFHSLEDRIVKNFFKHKALDCVCPNEIPICTCSKEIEGKVLTNKPIIASKKEILENSRSKSAKLRIIERVL